MLEVAGEKPIGTALNRGQQDWDVRFVTDESARAGDMGCLGGRHDFGARELDQFEVVGNDSPSLFVAKTGSPRKEMGLDLPPYNLRHHHSTDTCGAKSQDRLVQPPGGEDSASEHVGVEKETEPDGSRHPRFAFEAFAFRPLRLTRPG